MKLQQVQQKLELSAMSFFVASAASCSHDAQEVLSSSFLAAFFPTPCPSAQKLPAVTCALHMPVVLHVGVSWYAGGFRARLAHASCSWCEAGWLEPPMAEARLAEGMVLPI